MARPPRLNAEYFYHPADFRNDRRVKAVRARLGVAGYGLLLMLLEVLTDADHTWISTDEIELELLAGDLGVSATEIDSLLQLCEKVGLFRRTPAGMLSCDQLNTWLEPVFEKRNRAKNAATANKLAQAATETPATTLVSVAETQPVQNSTVENSTVEKNRERECASEEEQLAADLAYFDSLPLESPDAQASHTEGGAADVPTEVDAQAPYKAYDPDEFSPALVLPFDSGHFRTGWAKWRRYNAEELRRPLGGGMREQEALRKLGQLAKQSELVALAIIDQAISKGWKDLFPLDSSSPAFNPPTANSQRNAVHRTSSYSNQNSAAARLHTPAPSAEAGWGYPGQ